MSDLLSERVQHLGPLRGEIKTGDARNDGGVLVDQWPC
jgi:hypothetical protein